MKFKYLLLLTISGLLCFQVSYSQIYAGLGGGFLQPFGKFEETNKSAPSYIVNLENRYYCKLWYGVKFEYSDLKPVDGLDAATPYYNNILNISPQIRYNFLGLNCYDNVAFPYLQLGLTISSAGRSDNTARLGLGALGGGGVSYGFSLFDACFLLDANASYNLPNVILKNDKRDNIEYLHINLILNVKL